MHRGPWCGPYASASQPPVDELAERAEAGGDAVGGAADRGAVQWRDRAVGVAGDRDDRVAGAALVVAEARRPALAERAEPLVGRERGDVVEQRDQVRGVEDGESQRLVAFEEAVGHARP